MLFFLVDFFEHNKKKTYAPERTWTVMRKIAQHFKCWVYTIPPQGQKFKSVTWYSEKVGFEPTEALTSSVFKTEPLNHSGTFPRSIQPTSKIEYILDYVWEF